MWMSMVIYCALASLIVAGRSQSTDPLVTSNQCTLYQGGCRYHMILARSSCTMSQDEPTYGTYSTQIPTVSKAPAESEPAEDQIKKLEVLERKLVRMMEGLSIRSLRHIRQIKSDLREMTASMNLLKMKSRSGRGLGYDSAPIQCPPEFVGVGTWSSCYRFSNFNTSWHDAREYCSAFGSNLVALESLKEAYILDYIIKSNPVYQHPKGWWTSGNYIVRSRKWMWTSKHHLRPMQYTRWAPNQPDSRSSMHCMMLYRPADYHWHDAMCSDDHNFICEMELL